VVRDTVEAEGGTTSEDRRGGDKLTATQPLHSFNLVMKWRHEKKKEKIFY
jgi:hypothetical protein